jgi:RNA polymerase sigma-70 factor, ECF subfamily
MTLRQPQRRILHAAMNGDEQAFREIVEAYRPRLLWYVRGMVRDRQLAEEVVQEVFLSVYMHLSDFSEDGLFTSWLYRLARNKGLDAVRSAECRPKIDHLHDVDSLGSGLPADTENDRMVAAIWRAVAELDESLKRPLLLRDVTGLSYKEIGDTLQISLGMVKWRIYRARELVQQALAREGLTRSAAVAGASVEAADNEAGTGVERAS